MTRELPPNPARTFSDKVHIVSAAAAIARRDLKHYLSLDFDAGTIHTTSTTMYDRMVTQASQVGKPVGELKNGQAFHTALPGRVTDIWRVREPREVTSDRLVGEVDCILRDLETGILDERLRAVGAETVIEPHKDYRRDRLILPGGKVALNFLGFRVSEKIMKIPRS